MPTSFPGSSKREAPGNEVVLVLVLMITLLLCKPGGCTTVRMSYTFTLLCSYCIHDYVVVCLCKLGGESANAILTINQVLNLSKLTDDVST